MDGSIYANEFYKYTDRDCMPDKEVYRGRRGDVGNRAHVVQAISSSTAPGEDCQEEDVRRLGGEYDGSVVRRGWSTSSPPRWRRRSCMRRS